MKWGARGMKFAGNGSGGQPDIAAKPNLLSPCSHLSFLASFRCWFYSTRVNCGSEWQRFYPDDNNVEMDSGTVKDWTHIAGGLYRSERDLCQ